MLVVQYSLIPCEVENIQFWFSPFTFHACLRACVKSVNQDFLDCLVLVAVKTLVPLQGHYKVKLVSLRYQCSHSLSRIIFVGELKVVQAIVTELKIIVFFLWYSLLLNSFTIPHFSWYYFQSNFLNWELRVEMQCPCFACRWRQIPHHNVT